MSVAVRTSLEKCIPYAFFQTLSCIWASLNFWNVNEFSWSWIPKDCIQFLKGRRKICLDVTERSETGNESRGTETWKMGTRQRIKNEVTDRARVQVRFCFHFSFSRSRFLFLVLVIWSLYFTSSTERHTLQSHVVVLQWLWSHLGFDVGKRL